MSEILVVLGMGIVTAACRLVPFWISGRLPLSQKWVTWMKYIPVSILSAVIAPELIKASSDAVWGAVPLPLIATVPTVFVGILSRNLLASVAVGVSVVALLRAI